MEMIAIHISTFHKKSHVDNMHDSSIFYRNKDYKPIQKNWGVFFGYNKKMVDLEATYSPDELEFAIFCIENVAIESKKSAVEVYDLLKNSELLDKYIVANYGVLHTQGKEYIVGDIIELMRDKGLI